MTKRNYDLTIRVTEQKLPIILQLLDGEMVLLSVEPSPTQTPPHTSPITRTPHDRVHRYAGGKRDKGIFGKDLLVQIFKEANGAPLNVMQIAQKFVDRGFAHNSSSPLLSRFLQEKLIEQTAPSHYRWLGKK